MVAILGFVNCDLDILLPTATIAYIKSRFIACLYIFVLDH
jgi:hypothetical protein